MLDRGPFRIPLIAASLLAAAACQDGAEPAPAVELSPPAATEALLLEAADHPRLPLPEPVDERAVGARIFEYTIELTRDTVDAGPLELHVVNSGTTMHLLIVRNETEFFSTPHLLPGESATLTVDLKPGVYHLVCTVRDEFDHISEGERSDLVVL